MRKRYALQCPKCKKTGLLRLTSGRGGRLSVRCSNCKAILRCLIDRRPHPRKSPMPAVKVATCSTKRMEFAGELTDISATGCRVRTKDVLPEQGQELNLEIRLPVEFSELHIPGSVVWVRKAEGNTCEFGVNFSDLGDRTRQAIASSPIFMSARVSSKPDKETEHPPSHSHPLPPSIPDKELAGAILNADRYKTGSRASRLVGSPPVQEESRGILNADRYAWKSFKKDLLNADRYSWKNPGSRILNGRKYFWRNAD